MPEVISDTSPVQYLHQAGVLELLPALYGGVVLHRAVAAELAEGRRRGLALPDPTTLGWISVRAVREQALLPLVTDLGTGEREALALAVEVGDSLLLLDDALARRHARLLGLSFTGTLGVLLKASAPAIWPRWGRSLTASMRWAYAWTQPRAWRFLSSREKTLEISQLTRLKGAV